MGYLQCYLDVCWCLGLSLLGLSHGCFTPVQHPTPQHSDSYVYLTPPSLCFGRVLHSNQLAQLYLLLKCGVLVHHAYSSIHFAIVCKVVSGSPPSPSNLLQQWFSVETIAQIILWRRVRSPEEKAEKAGNQVDIESKEIQHYLLGAYILLRE